MSDVVYETPYPHLFSPIEIGGVRLNNRIVHASMSTHYRDGGKVPAKIIAYHANRIRGGASITVTEPMATLARQVGGARINIHADQDMDGLRRWTSAIRAEGGHILGQIQDGGRGRHEDGRVPSTISASSLPDDLSWIVPHALTTEEVGELTVQWAHSAKVMQDAGFSGVEFSAGHGHIFHQFMSMHSNRRTDRYGGDLEGRMRLLTDTIHAIRAACGRPFIIGVKLPGEDGVEGGIDMEQAAAITAGVHATGEADYITYCWGAHAETLDWHLPDLHGQRAPYVEKIATLGRHAPGVPIGALGLITDPNEGERAVRDGLADLVMMGRPLVTDPAWGVKAGAGREAEIRYCVSCNTCWHLIVTGSSIQCDNNPRVGQPDEADWRPRRTASPKKVVVVGAGVAGLEAAWTAAARGHEVVVFGASDEFGGKTRLHALLPGGENLSSVYDYQKLSADRNGVRFVFGRPAELDDVVAEAPDVVVIAAGATPSWPAFLPEEYRGEGVFPDVREAVAMMADVGQRQPGTALIYDHDQTAFTYATAEFLLPKFDKVAIVTPKERLASLEALVNRQGIYRRLYRKGVEVILLHNVLPDSEFEEGIVSLANVYTGVVRQVTDVALFTYATARLPNDALAAPLKARGIDVRLVGDAYAPRLLLNATSEGNRVGEAI